MKKIALLGYSGHAYVVADAVKLSRDQLLGYYERQQAITNPFGLDWLGDEYVAGALDILKQQSACAIVSVGENNIRRKVMQHLQHQQVSFTTVIHPASIVSGLATVADGCFIAAGAKVNPLATIGAGVILNTGCIVEHECSIAGFVHIAPGAVLAGSVQVGEGSFIGANAVVKQGVRIGSNVVIGAGAVVLKDIPDHQTWVGNPAREIIK
ncbi:acetyltransferase [Cesiribacter sp. SM1]|uniref:acetyltransferase n=1 Tax=Cesiribacter sp. SM1 TaxID=2861196 RepID=UPI001CD5ADC5|nr:acetyltransferase [Cesiribacter sp. SM1]